MFTQIASEQARCGWRRPLKTLRPRVAVLVKFTKLRNCHVMLETLLVVLTLLQSASSLQLNVHHRLLEPSRSSLPPQFTYKGTIDVDSTIRMSTSQPDKPCGPLTNTCHRL
jgi:hypothetical protein